MIGKPNRLDFIKKRMTESKRRHEEQHRLHKELNKRVSELYRENKEFQRYTNHARYSRFFIIVFNLIAWFLIVHYFGLKPLSIFFIVIFIIGGTTQFIFDRNLEGRILKPINQLKEAVNEISNGNYDIKVENNTESAVGTLIDAFNEMAAKLRDSEKLKLQYEENRKQLIANISHDLKTPITSIQGYIETMTERTDIPQDKVNKYHQIIDNNAKYMNRLIDDLFLFAKLDMQKLELDFSIIGIKAFMSDLMEEFKYELEERKIQFLYEDCLSQEFEVKMDRKRIYQVFRNIIGNAVKYGDERDIIIKVKLYSDESYIKIDIQDNGSGIPEDKLPYIFDRFYRIDYARTKNLMSTGLGLAIARELVEAHGGDISVVSEEGEGSCFTLLLPVEQVKGEKNEEDFDN